MESSIANRDIESKEKKVMIYVEDEEVITESGKYENVVIERVVVYKGKCKMVEKTCEGKVKKWTSKYGQSFSKKKTLLCLRHMNQNFYFRGSLKSN